jgi:transposase
VARNRAAPAEAQRDGPAVRLADARDLKWHLLRHAGRPARGRLLQNGLPPWETIHRWFVAWRDDGRFELISHALVMADRERVGRDACTTSAALRAIAKIRHTPLPSRHSALLEVAVATRAASKAESLEIVIASDLHTAFPATMSVRLGRATGLALERASQGPTTSNEGRRSDRRQRVAQR